MVADANETKDIIIEKSRTLFSKYGLFKTTIDEIAHALHMGKSSLYYYFRNKEDLFKAVIEKEFDILSEQIRQAVAEGSTPEEKLRIFSAKRMESFKNLTNAYSALRQEYLTDYAFIQELRTNFDRREMTFVQAILQEGIDKGDFSVADTLHTAHAVLIALKGLEYEWVLKGEGFDMEKDMAVLHEILLHGITRR